MCRTCPYWAFSSYVSHSLKKENYAHAPIHKMHTHYVGSPNLPGGITRVLCRTSPQAIVALAKLSPSVLQRLLQFTGSQHALPPLSSEPTNATLAAAALTSEVYVGSFSNFGIRPAESLYSAPSPKLKSVLA
jgi:hypothetical protein